MWLISGMCGCTTGKAALAAAFTLSAKPFEGVDGRLRIAEAMGLGAGVEVEGATVVMSPVTLQNWAW